MTFTKLTFGTSILSKLDDDTTSFDATVVIGKKKAIETVFDASFFSDTLGVPVSKLILNALLETLPGETSGSASTLVANNESVHKLTLSALSTKIARNNHPMSVHTLTSLVASHCAKGTVRLVILMDDTSSVGAVASAIAKAFPLFSFKTTNEQKQPQKRTVHVVFVRSDGSVVRDDTTLAAARAVADGVQLAARLVDTHPEQLTTTQFVKECQAIVDEFPFNTIKLTEIVGDELKAYGGIYSVGKAAVEPPRLVILEYDGGGDETIALVGKGIVYDTGGLALKQRAGMCGMKHDMAGAAGLLGGFKSAVRLQAKKKVYLLLCLAENAIGPTAFRNDDILTMYSGKTIEVNNCDAEGRLVLADGVAHATRHIKNLDLVVDMATLTGAQLICTGKKHAGILANNEELEKRAIAAGLHSGDLVYPMLYAPELLMDEFKSEVADYKNSVKDRSNAQSSCAGHFIEAHLEEGYKGGYLHVDMAGPGSKGDRGTGYGVGLVLSLLEAPGF
jgi:probable aminopeptidase NPEPL1